MKDKYQRTLSHSLLICLFCLITTLVIQAATTYALYRSALSFQQAYIQHTVDNIVLNIDVLRDNIQKHHKEMNQPITDEEIRNIIESILRKVFYEASNENGSYVWINEVINYEGGDDYARRLIHPNLRNTESISLSTQMQDAEGNYPYLTELEGVREHGSLFYSYYFKDLGADTISKKLSYARLYPDYNWIICMGIPYHAVWENIYAGSTALKFIILCGYLLSLCGIIATSLYALRLYWRQHKLQQDELNVLQQVIDTDSLTRAHSRHYGTARLKELLDDYHDTEQNTIIAMFDIDYFKTVNDTYGHDFGDIVLRETVEQIKNNIRREDCLIRWGGDEFIIILPHMSRQDLEQQLKRLNQCIRSHTFANTSGKLQHITISIGATSFQSNDISIDTTLKRVDNALYQAKKVRNTFHIESDTLN
ncbi:diguanylate cyclase (GGDEF) domain-containing protein [Selenomonas sp. GACV-9]|uniref:sensor domain-containing diguanylate cyclase n=1 Tax=Selenomonas sp. GACV-9 TaxID=3158782 RepID=UPI0008EA3C56|nr:diguanylate cyclase (GGDEF) domain-containing protein [Selenomonas ruminantium]